MFTAVPVIPVYVDEQCATSIARIEHGEKQNDADLYDLHDLLNTMSLLSPCIATNFTLEAFINLFAKNSQPHDACSTFQSRNLLDFCASTCWAF